MVNSLTVFLKLYTLQIFYVNDEPKLGLIITHQHVYEYVKCQAY